jgi:adenylate cyclase
MKGGSAFRQLGLLAPLLVVALGLLVFLWNPVPVQVMRHTVFDQFQRWQPRVYSNTQANAPVRIIAIDEESLRRLGQWPWPRTLIAQLTTRLQAAQPSAIAFDVLFSEPDRTSPQSMARIWRAPSLITETLRQLPDHDVVLAQAFARGPVVLGFAMGQLLGETEPPESATFDADTALQLTKTPFVAVGNSALQAVHGFSQSVIPLAALQQPARGLGALAYVPDSDGVIRRIPLLLRYGNQLLPALSAEALRVAQGANHFVTRSTEGPGGSLQDIRIGALTVPTNSQGEVWLHYTRDEPGRYVAAWEVMAGTVPPEALRGKILLVGATAPGLMDLRFTPLSRALPGVEIHAQVVEQLLAGTGLQRPAWAQPLEAAALLAGGTGVGWLALATPALVSFGWVAALLALLWALVWWAFSAHAVLLDPVLFSLVILLSFVAASIVRHLASERRQAWIKQAFSRYVSPNLVTHLIDQPGALELGGKRQQCSFVFTDLAGFTALMEQMNPAEAVGVLNVYLDRMIAIAFSHEGTLDRVVGDAVAIMFSAPLAQADHQRRALACALEMQRFAQSYEAELKARGMAFCQTRIGVHSGEVIVGNFGGAAIFDYRALGDPVNTASRLEAANKLLGTLVCVSEATLQGCPDALVRPVGRLLLPGKTQPLMAYEPRLNTLPDAPDHWPAYTQAFELMKHTSPRALPEFEALRRLHPDDPLVKLHRDRLAAGDVGDLITLASK